MSYKKIKEEITNIERCGSVFGLDTMRDLLRETGYKGGAKIFHIAGTNGKGSVCSFISSALKEQGYKTGLYTSPGVFSYRERFRINGRVISKAEFCLAAKKVLKARERLIQKGVRPPTAFEIETAVALLWFEKKGCDTIVLETGLGGRLDATNAIENKFLCVICSISLDHTALLGDTKEKIAKEKFAIAKDTPFVTLKDNEVYLEDDFKKRATFTKDFRVVEDSLNGLKFIYGGKEYKSNLLGAHQAQNASLAIEALVKAGELGLKISQKAIERGIEKAVHHGRLEPIKIKGKTFILDGGHNEGGALSVRRAMESYFSDKSVALVIGMFKDKDYKTVIRLLAEKAAFVAAVSAPTERGLSSKEVAMEAEKHCGAVNDCGDIKLAIKEAAARFDSVIITGSLSILKEAKKAIKRLIWI
ncbi:MAG: hypothetical protein GX891_03640 [Clostridiales bacterium]|nr:hypothetical protein [Clostridiales bacterium]